MSALYGSSNGPPRRSIFDDSDDDNLAETDPFLSRPKIAAATTTTATTTTTDAHTGPSTPARAASRSTAPLPSADVQQDHFPPADRPPSYQTPIRTRSYESPANDPWSSTPRTNGVPVATPNFPRRASMSIPAAGSGETASYLLDADHINIQKADEKEGIVGFKHVNYMLASARRGTQVVRRYSDFAW